MDRISDPLWNRLDDFIRAMIAAFFIAIFAVVALLTPTQNAVRMGIVDAIADRRRHLLQAHAVSAAGISGLSSGAARL